MQDARNMHARSMGAGKITYPVRQKTRQENLTAVERDQQPRDREERRGQERVCCL